MSEQVVNDEPGFEVSAGEAESVGGGTSKPATREAALSTRFRWKVYSIGWGTSVAGAAYPVVFAFICLTAELLGSIVWFDGPNHPNEIIAAVFAASTFGAVIGFFCALLVCICVLPFVYFFVRSLALRGSVVRLGAFSGGLVGFVAVLPMSLVVLLEAQSSSWQFAGWLLLGPALTTVLGQIGGAWGGWRVGSYERAVAKEWAGARSEVEIAAAIDSAADGLPSPTRFQFGIWHLLVISVWASLLLTAIRLSGIDFGFAIAVLVGWLVFQSVTLWTGGIAAAQFGRWRAQRQTRST